MSETKWLHKGKECNRPVFSQHWEGIIYLELKGDRKCWCFSNYKIKWF